MRLVLATMLALTLAAPAHAQLGSVRNTSEASKQVVVAVGAIGESGVKAASGVVAIPLGSVAVASGAVAHGAGASGYTDVETAFSAGASSATGAAKSFVDFSGAPLTVTDNVVLGQKAKSSQTARTKGAPAAQAAPNVPFAPDQN